VLWHLERFTYYTIFSLFSAKKIFFSFFSPKSVSGFDSQSASNTQTGTKWLGMAAKHIVLRPQPLVVMRSGVEPGVHWTNQDHQAESEFLGHLSAGAGKTLAKVPCGPHGTNVLLRGTGSRALEKHGREALQF
jgi:hypothetical protein